MARLIPLRDSWTQRAVLAELRRVILAGDAPPGTPVPLEDVAAVLGVSVIPVRESLKILVGEGLVEQHERAAYTVARLARSELLELYTARSVLETTVLAVAVAVADPHDHAHARAAHDLLVQAECSGDVRAYHRESRAFHLALLAPARMRRFGIMVESAWNLTESYRPMAQLAAATRTQLQDDHRELLAAFVAGEAEALLACATAHHARLREVVATLPAELFADEPSAAPGPPDGRPPCTSP